jgi:hypothetical protein
MRQYTTGARVFSRLRFSFLGVYMSRSFFWSCIAFLAVVLFFLVLTGLSLAETVSLDLSPQAEKYSSSFFSIPLYLSPQAEEFFSSVISIFAGVVCGFAAIMTWGSWR